MSRTLSSPRWSFPSPAQEGLDDLAAGRSSIPGLLVAVGASRLRRAGVPIPARRVAGAEHRLYALLARSDPDSAHSRYNALIRRLISFERAIECVVFPAIDPPSFRRTVERVRVSGSRGGRVAESGPNRSRRAKRRPGRGSGGPRHR